MTERVIIVGAGGISDAWFPPLIAEGVEVAAVVDLRPEAAKAKLDKYQLSAPVFGDLCTALRKTSADFLLDLTIPEAHCGVTVAALKAGLPVIGEKPMASSMAEARRMVAAAEKAERLYMVSQSRRWDVRHDRVRRTLASNALGEINTINCDFFLGVHFGGFRDVMPSPLILDMAIHHFDMARFFTGLDPVAVYAHEYNPHGSWYAGDVAAVCIFEMSNGAIFTYRGSWCAEGCHTSWNGDWRIVGDRGTLIYERDNDPHGQLVAGDEGSMRPLAPLTVADSPLEFTGMHGGLLEMLAYLRTGKKPQTECHDNINSLAMVFAAMESARKGKRVLVRGM